MSLHRPWSHSNFFSADPIQSQDVSSYIVAWGKLPFRRLKVDFINPACPPAPWRFVINTNLSLWHFNEAIRRSLYNRKSLTAVINFCADHVSAVSCHFPAFPENAMCLNHSLSVHYSSLINI